MILQTLLASDGMLVLAICQQHHKEVRARKHVSCQSESRAGSARRRVLHRAEGYCRVREKVSTHKLASCLDEGEVPEPEFLDVLVPNCLTVCKTGQKCAARLHEAMISASCRGKQNARRLTGLQQPRNSKLHSLDLSPGIFKGFGSADW